MKFSGTISTKIIIVLVFVRVWLWNILSVRAVATREMHAGPTQHTTVPLPAPWQTEPAATDSATSPTC